MPKEGHGVSSVRWSGTADWNQADGLGGPTCASRPLNPLPPGPLELPAVSVSHKDLGGGVDEMRKLIRDTATGILRPASPTVCDIPARPGAEPCKRRDIMDNKSRRKIVSLLGPLSSLPHAACWNHEPCDHEARSSCKYIGSLASQHQPRFILLRQWGEGDDSGSSSW